MATRPRPIVWQFFQCDDYRWCWRQLRRNGTLIRSSEPFDDFGQCVSNALKNGFRPRQQHYTTKHGEWTDDYLPGKEPTFSRSEPRPGKKRSRVV